MSFEARSIHRAADQLLLRAERAIALLARVQPLNARFERQRLGAAWQAGKALAPRFSYQAAPDMYRLRQALDAFTLRAGGGDVVSQLYAERAAELALETRLVEEVGRSQFKLFAAKRFLSEETSQVQADTLALNWVRQGPGNPSAAECIASDDETQPKSLVSLMRKEISERKLAVRVSPSQDLSALAATGEATVYVATGCSIRESTARRIVAHEVLGHCIPRINAKSERLGLFVVGTARGNDEQEGYALSIEQQSGHMDQERRFELGLRHRVAKAMFEGADFWSAVKMSQELGTSLTQALTIAFRVSRGGGLGREVSYLPAFCRVTHCEDADLVHHLSRGRLSLRSLRRLREAEQLS